MVLLLVVAACSKDKVEPEQRPDKRLGAALTEYQARLAAAETGWIGYLFPEGGGGYTFKFIFTNNNRVISYADINATSINTPLESSYRLKATQLPSLYFDTYSYIHILADPDPKRSGGAAGVGLSSDFEFSIVKASTDTFELKGNLNGSRMLLVRAKANEGNDYVAKAAAYNNTLDNIAKFTYYYNQFTVGGKQYNMTINPDQQTVSFYYDDNGFKRFTTDYAASTSGIIFKEPFIHGNLRIAEFHDLNVDVAQKKVSLMAGTTAITTENVATPIIIDKDAPTLMYIANLDYYSTFGFTRAGVVDAYNMRSIPDFNRLIFDKGWGNSAYDVLVFQRNNIADYFSNYGPAYSTQLDPVNGKVFYTYLGALGTSPGNAYTTMLTNIRNQFASRGDIMYFKPGKDIMI